MRKAWGSARLTLTLVWLLSVCSAEASISVVGSLDHHYTLAPGETFEGYIQVNNSSDEPAIVRVELADYGVTPEGNAYYPKPNSHPRSLAKYIQMMPPEQTIAPLAQGKVGFKVTLPTLTDLPELAGAYWAVLLVRQSELAEVMTAPTLDEWVIKERFQTAVRITASVRGNGLTQLHYEGARLVWPESKDQTETNHPLFEVDMVNDGAHLLDLELIGELFDRTGESLGRTALGALRIYPGHRRRVEWVLDSAQLSSHQPPTELWLMANPRARMIDRKRFGGRFMIKPRESARFGNGVD